jgi:hypothetical protein
MKNTRLIVAAFFCGMTLIVGGVLWSLDPGVSEQRLADGSVLVLRGVTYGKVHRLGVGNWAQRVAGQVLPEALARPLGIKVLAHTNSAPVLVVWLEHRQQTAASRRPSGGYMATPVTVSDGAGTEFETAGSSFSVQGTNDLVEGYVFGCFPGASPMVDIRVRPFDYATKTSFDAAFRVRNPAYVSRPPARQTVYPVRAQKDGLVFELTSFLPSAHPGKNLEATKDSSSWMRLAYRISDTIEPTSQWLVRQAFVRDASGGVYWPTATSSPGEAARTNFYFRGGLNTNLDWTLGLSLACSSYASNEVLAVKDIPVSGSDALGWQPVSAELQGVTLKVTGFRRPGYASAGFSPPTEGLRLELIRVTDDSGHDGKVTVTGVQGGCDYHFGVNLSSNATRANLTFALRRDRRIEVTARPGSPDVKNARPDSAPAL